MTGVFTYGDALYDIDDAKVAAWNGDGTYGTLIDVPGISSARIEFVPKTQDGYGDGGLILTASAIQQANMTIRNFGIKADMIEALFGASSDEYSPGASAYTIVDMPVGVPLPYFGMVIRSFDNEIANAGALIFVPKIRVVGNFQWELSYNNFVQPELTGRALPDGNLPSNISVNVSRFVRVYKYKILPSISAMPI